MDLKGPQDFDLLVIGAGASGTALARDAAGRGLSVCLVEHGDLATEIAPGMQPCAIERSDLAERERLCAIAPHLVRSIDPPQAQDRLTRPRWLTPFLPGRDDTINALWVDALRLVVLTAVDAAAQGAQIRTRTDCLKLTRKRDRWSARLKGPHGVQDIAARQVAQTGDAETLKGETVLLDRGWDGRAPALLTMAEAPPTAAYAVAARALAVLGIDGPDWVASVPLPGGDIPSGDFATFHAQQARFFPWLPPATLRRMAHAYGTRLPRVMGEARRFADLGQHFGGGLTAAEVIYLIHHEFARSVDDVLWRRTALGQGFGSAALKRLTHWFERTRIDEESIEAAIQSAGTA